MQNATVFSDKALSEINLKSLVRLPTQNAVFIRRENWVPRDTESYSWSDNGKGEEQAVSESQGTALYYAQKEARFWRWTHTLHIGQVTPADTGACVSCQDWQATDQGSLC